MLQKKNNIRQDSIIKKCKKYLIEEKKKNIDTSISPLCFFTTWASTPGYFKLFELNDINKKNHFFFTIKNLLSISKNVDLKLFTKDQKITSNAQNLIISYSTKKNFDHKGNFFDNYLNFNSKDRNFFWFLISIDNFVPQKFQENVAVIAKKNKSSFSLSFFLKYLLEVVIKSNFKINAIKHSFWQESNYSKIVYDNLKNLIKALKIKNLILVYENMPFQNYIINEIKKFDTTIKTIGYLHCAPWPLQLDLIYKDQSLDTMIVSGKEQKKVLKKYFGWARKEVEVIPSLRFYKKKKKEFSGYLFVPYNLDEKSNDYLERLELYLSKNRTISCNYKVRIHPLNSESKKHLDFKKKCESILSKYFIKNNEKLKNHSLFFGSLTGVSIQALEEGTIITHFANEESFDTFSTTIWSNLHIKKVGEGTYMYNLKKKNYTFLINNKKNKFHKYLKPFLKK